MRDLGCDLLTKEGSHCKIRGTDPVKNPKGHCAIRAVYIRLGENLNRGNGKNNKSLMRPKASRANIDQANDYFLFVILFMGNLIFFFFFTNFSPVIILRGAVAVFAIILKKKSNRKIRSP